MTEDPWYWYLPVEKRQAIDRTVARQSLEILLPQYEQLFAQWVKEGIIPIEMMDALLDLSRDPLERQATLNRIGGMIEEYAARAVEKQTIAGILQKLQSEIELLRSQTVSQFRATPIEQPLPLPDADGWDAVFSWYYDVPRTVCRTLRELSEKIGYTYGHVRNMHKEYKAEHPNAKK